MKRSEILPYCIHLLLRPVIKFCLSNSVKIQEVHEITKKTFIELAEKELLSSGQDVSVSRLSIVTGIHRRDVVRLQDDIEPAKKGVNMIVRILGHWQQNKEFKTASGRPRALEYEGLDSEFAELVATVSRELNPYTILFELERVGAVKKSKGKVSLKARTFMPKANAKEGFLLLSSDCEDLIEGVCFNIFEEPSPPNLHIKTSYDNIPASKIPQLRDWVLKAGSAFQQKCRNYLSQFDRDINPDIESEEPSGRICVGTFSNFDTESSEEINA